MTKSSHTLIRAVLPHPIDTAIKHLAVDLSIPVTRLMVDAAVLLLKHHGREVPKPALPAAKKPRAAKNGGAR